jgi:hypothetical protein
MEYHVPQTVLAATILNVLVAVQILTSDLLIKPANSAGVAVVIVGLPEWARRVIVVHRYIGNVIAVMILTVWHAIQIMHSIHPTVSITIFRSIMHSLQQHSKLFYLH